MATSLKSAQGRAFGRLFSTVAVVLLFFMSFV